MPRGTSTVGDVVTQTIDGRPLNDLWREFSASLELRNRRRTAIESLLSYQVAQSAEAVAQAVLEDAFERASEFGEPIGLRSDSSILTTGYSFEWYDAATRFTWRFLVEATGAQVESVHASMLESDNRAVFKNILGALLNNTRRTNEKGATVYPLYAGAADDAPPSYMARTWAANHNHYLSSNGAFEGTDLEAAIRTVTEHGYGTQPGSRVLVLANEVDADVIRSFRAGQVSADTSKSRWDFIPGTAAPAFLSAQQIIGAQAPAALETLPLIGSIGPAYVAEDSNVPQGYVVVVATGGSNSDQNPVAFREHARPEYRGLRLIRGGNADYPVQDSFYGRGLGTGIRKRGAAAVLQVTTNATYTAPATFAGLV